MSNGKAEAAVREFIETYETYIPADTRIEFRKDVAQVSLVAIQAVVEIMADSFRDQGFRTDALTEEVIPS